MSFRSRRKIFELPSWSPATVLNALLVLTALGGVFWVLLRTPFPQTPVMATAASHPAGVATAGHIALRITPRREFYWNGEGPYPLEGFAGRLAAACRRQRDVEIAFTADPGVEFGDARLILDAIRDRPEVRLSDLAPQ